MKRAEHEIELGRGFSILDLRHPLARDSRPLRQVGLRPTQVSSAVGNQVTDFACVT